MSINVIIVIALHVNRIAVLERIFLRDGPSGCRPTLTVTTWLHSFMICQGLPEVTCT
jgi:hypothetical protein